ncbi:MAG: recombinase family protein [Thermoguttaceae bacterium]
MNQWWQVEPQIIPSKLRAVAYYRHSAEIGQENSVEIQQDHVRAFAKKCGIDIIHEYADRGKSGLTVEGRPQFQEMMERVANDNSFQYVLCLDVSRWGRFQDTDLSAHYESICTLNGKKVVFSSHGKLDVEEDAKLIGQLRKSIDRYQAAEYSKTLSGKVFSGAAKVASKGYRPGGSPPYGMQRVMLDEKKERDRVLQPGQRKAIQNGRVILEPGEEKPITIINEIFLLFTESDCNESQIAGILNQRGEPSPGGVRWSSGSVHNILSNEQYAGSVVYNKTSSRLKSATRQNPKSEWVVTPNSYIPIISRELFEKARAKIQNRRTRMSPTEVYEKIKHLYEQFGFLSHGLLRQVPDMPKSTQVISQFGSMTEAYHSLFSEIVNRTRETVFAMIHNNAAAIEQYDNFLVIDERFTVKLEPAIAVNCGYKRRWNFRMDKRPSVDITLGIPLSDHPEPEILGYFPLPRVIVPNDWFCLSDGAYDKIEMWGYTGLNFINELLQTGGGNA